MRLGLVVVSLFISSILAAQPGAGDPNGGGKPGNPVPFSGIELLIGAGALLGAKKAFDKRKK